MSVGARMRGAWKALFGPGGTPQAAGGLLAGIFPYGQVPRRGTRELMQAYRNLPWLRTVVHRIANDVAAAPWRLYRQRAGGAASRQAKHLGSGAMRRKLVGDLVADGGLQEISAHPLLDLLGEFNPALGAQSSLLSTQICLDLKGETFWVYERTGGGLPMQLWPIPPHWVTETPSASRPWFRVNYQGWNRLIAEEDVLWLRSPDPENPYGRGAGLGESLADELDIDEYAAKHVKAWFYNRALPDAIVSLEGIGETEARRFKQTLIDQYRGVEKAHQVHVTNAKLSVEMLAQTFKDQQLSELRQLQRDTVIQVFNVPPELLGIIENSNRATIDASYYLYAQGVLCPRLDFLCDAIQRLAAEWDEALVCDYVSPVPEDREFTQKVMAAVPSVFTIDEHRSMAGAAPLPGGVGEVLYQPPAVQVAQEWQGTAEEPLLAPPAEMPPALEEEEEAFLLPPAQKIVGQEIANVLDALRPERIVQEVTPVWEKRLVQWGNRVLRELGAKPTFDLRNPLVRQHLERFAATKITGQVNETTREAIRATLAEGAAAGEGIGTLKRRVTEVFDQADKARARMIARTEVVGSANFGNLEAYRQSGVVGGKEWLAVRDEATRDTHLDLDGQVVALAERFVAPDGASAQHPGAFGDPAQDIACRCSVLPVVDAPDKAALSEAEKTAEWKRFDRRAVAWELDAARALRRGFRRQERDVLAALDRLA